VGRFRGDAELLRICALFEAAQNALDRWPEPGSHPKPTA
jgi:aspartyl-tRNA(Asn)/glutamyl-tRNA(Gln) amidotransferase subunit A